jgi:hypothetical protein
MKFYFDESGNTGNILLNDTLDFHEQPYFVLGAIGGDKESINLLNEKCLKLKDKYNIQMPELKSSSIYKNYPDFFGEIMEYIWDRKIPYFIEFIDKKFFLCMQITDSFILPATSWHVSGGVKYSLGWIKGKKEIAAYLYKNLSENYFVKFSQFIHSPTEKEFLKIINELKVGLDKENGLADIIVKHINETVDDFHKINESNQSEKYPYEFFIPIPDMNKKGKQMYSLPHINCFTNLIFRIGEYLDNKDEKNINLIHDNQKQFDENLVENLENFQENILFKDLKQNFNLNFSDSKKNVPIQIIDLIIGVIYRHWRDFQKSKFDKIDSFDSIMHFLLTYDKIFLGKNMTGINYVVLQSEYNTYDKFLFKKIRSEMIKAL